MSITSLLLLRILNLPESVIAEQHNLQCPSDSQCPTLRDADCLAVRRVGLGGGVSNVVSKAGFRLSFVNQTFAEYLEISK